MPKAMRRWGLAVMLCLAGCSNGDDSDHEDSFADGGGSYYPGSGGSAGGSGKGASSAYRGSGGTGGSSGAHAPGLEPPAADAGLLLADEDAGSAIEPLPAAANPFVLAKYDPFSTFGADVDTASYDIFTRDIAFGNLPAPGSVRLEDFVNFFTYDYPAPEAGAAQPFAISLAATRGVYARETALLRVGIQAVLPSPRDDKQANLVFLVDVSGSMAEELPLVQHVLRAALDTLNTDDRVSIVTYAGSTEVRLKPTAVSETKTITAAIATLQSGGSTNGAGGIQLAYAQAEAAFIQSGINHVVLCTDGDFNVGASSDNALVELIKEKRKTGITLTALGFGTEHINDSMMEKVSNAGNGIYSVVTSDAQADRYAKERLLATIVHVAKDMKIQVELNPTFVRAYRLLGYEDRAIADADFRVDTVDAGEIGAGHRVTALYELVLTSDPLPAGTTPVTSQGQAATDAREVSASDLALVKVRYKRPDAGEADPASEVSSTLAPEEITSSPGEADDDLRWAAAVAGFAELLKQSAFADRAALDALGATFELQRGRDRDRAAFADQFRTARALLE